MLTNRKSVMTLIHAAAMISAVALAGCKNEPTSGSYCSEKRPDKCIKLTFDKDMMAEVKILDGTEVLFEGNESYHLGSIKLNPKEGHYAGKPLQLAFDHDDRAKFDFEVYGESSHEVFRKK